MVVLCRIGPRGGSGPRAGGGPCPLGGVARKGSNRALPFTTFPAFSPKRMATVGTYFLPSVRTNRGCRTPSSRTQQGSGGSSARSRTPIPEVRRISISERMKSGLAAQPLENAAAMRECRCVRGVYPDRGSQFRCRKFRTARTLPVIGSMGRAKSCVHYAVMESFSAFVRKVSGSFWSVRAV